MATSLILRVLWPACISFYNISLHCRGRFDSILPSVKTGRTGRHFGLEITVKLQSSGVSAFIYRSARLVSLVAALCVFTPGKVWAAAITFLDTDPNETITVSVN